MDTFVVRVYRQRQDVVPDDDCLRGVVEEISTGFRATFHDTKQLLSILYRQLSEPPREAPPCGESPRAIAIPLDASATTVQQLTQLPGREGPSDPGQDQT